MGIERTCKSEVMDSCMHRQGMNICTYICCRLSDLFIDLVTTGIFTHLIGEVWISSLYGADLDFPGCISYTSRRIGLGSLSIHAIECQFGFLRTITTLRDPPSKKKKKTLGAPGETEVQGIVLFSYSVI